MASDQTSKELGENPIDFIFVQKVKFKVPNRFKILKLNHCMAREKIFLISLATDTFNAHLLFKYYFSILFKGIETISKLVSMVSSVYIQVFLYSAHPIHILSKFDNLTTNSQNTARAIFSLHHKNFIYHKNAVFSLEIKVSIN